MTFSRYLAAHLPALILGIGIGVGAAGVYGVATVRTASWAAYQAGYEQARQDGQTERLRWD